MAVLVLSALSWAWTMDPDAIRPCLPAGNVHSKDIQVSQKETVLVRVRLTLSGGTGSRLLRIFDGWSPSQVEKPHRSCSSKVS